MSVYTSLDTELILACQNFQDRKENEAGICELFKKLGFKIKSLEDRRLQDLVESVPATFDIFWYAMAMDVEETQEGYDEIRKEILPYVDKIEKLIIRGSAEGDSITAEERQEWWKMPKERERDEFYKMNGYYEDEQ